MTCTHDCNQGRSCTCTDTEEAGLWIRIPDLIILMTVMVTIGIILGVTLFRAGMMA